MIMINTSNYQMIVLQPQGSLNAHSGTILEKQLTGLMSHQLCVINLAQIDFIDRHGLVVLVTALKAARKSGCRLVLCNLQAPVKLVFELTQLDTVFEIFESYDAVLTTVSAPTVIAA